MSSTSSCASSPFTSPESCAEMDLLDLPMFFPNETSNIYQQILDLDGSNELLTQQRQQQQQQQQYQSYAPAQQQKHQYEMPHIGLGTPPTSPSAPAFYKHIGGATEIGTMYYSAQPQAIQNAYVIPTAQPVQHKELQQQLAYHVMMQQFDNLESSLFSPSPTTSSCSSSLSNSPYADASPLAAISSDFDLFPLNNGPRPQQQVTTSGYPSAPVMAPSVMAQSMFSNSNSNTQAGVYQNQMTPPMNQLDLERDVSSLFSQQQQQQHPPQQQQEQPMTTEMSLLCKCPGQYPCGDPLPGTESMIDSSLPHSSSPLDEIREEFSESESSSEFEEQDFDPSYLPTSYHPRSNSMMTAVASAPSDASKRKSDKTRAKSMVISTSASPPYSSPYSKDLSHSSPASPVRQDRRRSSSSSSFGGSQLVHVDNLPPIEDPHVCPVCSRRFNRPFNLRSHILTHTTARPFPCTLCSWKFTRHHDLLRHCKAKHPEALVNGDKKSGEPQTFSVV
ncbi:hypothetical protein BGZ67_007707 [Mortierella alpina]|nr:hypothetical protein BGZ67_007707 [Mortierella alpina]